MSSTTWLLLLLVAALPVGAAVLWRVLGRAEPFEPGPDGFWRAPLRRTHYGLRVEPDLVRVHGRGPRWQAGVGLFLILGAWFILGTKLLRPFASDLPLPAPMRTVLALRKPIGCGDVGLGILGVVFGVLNIAASLRRTDVILEARGDLRWHHHGWLQPSDGSLPVEQFGAFSVKPDGSVLLTPNDPAIESVPLFRLRSRELPEHVDDFARATAAFRALIARRA